MECHSPDLYTSDAHRKCLIFQGDSGGPLHIDAERGFMETVGMCYMDSLVKDEIFANEIFINKVNTERL